MRRTAQEARATRDRIVATAVRRASTDGVFGLTVGSLADAVGMSKAGLVKPFGSRHNLQMAVVAKAGEMFNDAVVQPSLAAESGLPRLHAIIIAWCGYLETCPFPGGCFVTAAASELDGRPGELRDALRDLVGRWHGFLHEQVTAARAAGALRPDIQPDDVITTLSGLAMAANQQTQLLADTAAVTRARRLMLHYLQSTVRR